MEGKELKQEDVQEEPAPARDEWVTFSEPAAWTPRQMTGYEEAALIKARAEETLARAQLQREKNRSRWPRAVTEIALMIVVLTVVMAAGGWLPWQY